MGNSPVHWMRQSADTGGPTGPMMANYVPYPSPINLGGGYSSDCDDFDLTLKLRNLRNIVRVPMNDGSVTGTCQRVLDLEVGGRWSLYYEPRPVESIVVGFERAEDAVLCRLTLT